ncbi:hypothetical protein ABFS82_14G008900 [Erythranthe guttata]|uniref:C2 domain-containing protein n=1 Tax=Erythranthe guttata TaxID=4155 RepID=A0A022S2P6_ERYGU|nr:PREDICTED: extensin [Erythranthe guttata]EYU45555.1 hypothetical protein MIMGU_mgv1a018032mg [Erythranthe guttata]|eukprot:XP_012842187.1 PREDICTED: extensin [Erythranthe guttata]
MENRTLEITIQNAKDLKKVNLITKMDAYVVVSISGGDKKWRQRTKTPVDHDGDANPTWNFPMKFTVEEAALQQNRLIIDFNLVCQRALGDKDIGEVHVPIKELLDTPAKGGAAAAGKRFVSYQVKKPSGKPKGQLSFSYKFSEETTTSAPPASPPPSPPPPAEMVLGESVSSAYPAVGPGLEYSPMAGWYPPDSSCPTTTVAADGGGGYYPPPVGYAPDSDPTPGGFPPPPVYGYAPPPPGYGYTPPPVYGYAPPPPGYGYDPPPPVYGYTPPPPGYGYDPPPPPSMPDYGYTPQPGYGYPPQPGYGNPHTVRL